MNLLNKKWYRNLFNNRTFVKSDGQWIDFKKYIRGKITEVDGKWRTQAFCECGNELIHTNSFVSARETKNHDVWDYVCKSCGKKQHWNPSLMMGLVLCDFEGDPL